MRPAVLACVLAMLPFASRLAAQTVVPAGPMPTFKDTSLIKPPAGQKTAVIEFEDLECPLCAHDSAIVRAAVARYKIPYLRHDYPLYEIHVWSTQAAITARYLEDKVSPEAAEHYRLDVFASQQQISSKDDLANFTSRWFAAHKLAMPFVVDPSGRFAAEVQADRTLGERIGVHETPTIFIVGPKGWVDLRDISQLYTVLDKTQEEAKNSAPAVHNNVRKPRTTQK